MLVAVIFWLFVAAATVQFFFLVYVFPRLTLHRADTAPNTDLQPVSVLVAAHNELPNLRELLPLLQNQNYPDFEVIVLDDRSNDGTNAFAQHPAAAFDRVRFVHIKETYSHITPKKYALTVGVKQAKHDIILLTDADCRPESDGWIGRMMAQLTADKEIVLGFSPYEARPGFLNSFVRYETFYTALQYFSFALAGSPYMGVGRNLLYRKSVFLKNRGFFSHINVVGGDDDLLMNEIATAANTAVCVHPDAFVGSFPKETWGAWFTQKKRHLSVGKYYKTRHKVALGLLSGSQVLTWALGIFLLTQPAPTRVVVGALLGGRLLVLWLVHALANRKLGSRADWYTLPFYDFLTVFYVGFMATTSFLNRKNRVIWK